jgi:hypothetical protein
MTGRIGDTGRGGGDAIANSVARLSTAFSNGIYHC